MFNRNGGYSSIGFNSIEDSLLSGYEGNKKYYYSSDNFIFLFEVSKVTQNVQISRVTNNNKATCDSPSSGFSFGSNSFFMNGGCFENFV